MLIGQNVFCIDRNSYPQPDPLELQRDPPPLPLYPITGAVCRCQNRGGLSIADLDLSPEFVQELHRQRHKEARHRRPPDLVVQALLRRLGIES